MFSVHSLLDGLGIGLTESGGMVQTDTSLLATNTALRDTAAAIRDDFSGGNGNRNRFGVINEDTASINNRLFNLNGYNFKFKNGSIKLSSKDSIGNVFTYNWDSNPLSIWFDESSATVTTDGTGTTFTGGSPTVSDGYGLTYFNNFYFTGPNMTFSTKVVVKQKNNSSTGFGFKFSPRYGGITYISHFMLSDTSGYVSFTNDNMPNSGSVKSSTSSTFKWDVYDTLLAKVVFRSPYYAEAILTNLKTGIEASVKIPGAVVFTRLPRPFNELNHQYALSSPDRAQSCSKRRSSLTLPITRKYRDHIVLILLWFKV
jgi:hypothetical protein